MWDQHMPALAYNLAHNALMVDPSYEPHYIIVYLDSNRISRQLWISAAHRILACRVGDRRAAAHQGQDRYHDGVCVVHGPLGKSGQVQVHRHCHR